MALDRQENKNYVFVYGTLKKGQPRHEILIDGNAEFVDEAVLEGYEMYDTGYYPGIVEGKGVIYGEVYKVSDDLIEVLDIIEGVDYNLFKREAVVVNLLNQKQKIYVWAYIFNMSVSNFVKIHSGKY